jgi:hypothetical protein
MSADSRSGKSSKITDARQSAHLLVVDADPLERHRRDPQVIILALVWPILCHSSQQTLVSSIGP